MHQINVKNYYVGGVSHNDTSPPHTKDSYLCAVSSDNGKLACVGTCDCVN
jgi:hypothetical protein